jgi:hypothetical protein
MLEFRCVIDKGVREGEPSRLDPESDSLRILRILIKSASNRWSATFRELARLSHVR